MPDAADGHAPGDESTKSTTIDRPGAERARRDAASPRRGGHHDDGRGSWREEIPGDSPPARERPRGRPFSRSFELRVDRDRATLLGAGLAMGAILGAGIALLTAPQSGERTRHKIAHASRRASHRAAEAWDGLGDDLRVAQARARRSMRRGLRTGRRGIGDALDDLDGRALRGLRSIRESRAHAGRESEPGAMSFRARRYRCD